MSRYRTPEQCARFQKLAAALDPGEPKDDSSRVKKSGSYQNPPEPSKHRRAVQEAAETQGISESTLRKGIAIQESAPLPLCQRTGEPLCALALARVALIWNRRRSLAVAFVGIPDDTEPGR